MASGMMHVAVAAAVQAGAPSDQVHAMARLMQLSGAERRDRLMRAAAIPVGDWFEDEPLDLSPQKAFAGADIFPDPQPDDGQVSGPSTSAGIIVG